MSGVQLARFSEVHSQGARFAQEMNVPLGAYQKMTAEELFLVMSSPALGGPFATDPGISEDQGLVAAIVKCSANEGPYLHAHYNTLESFTCLSGQFRINWGENGEHEALLDTFDTIAVPRGVVRTFTNATDETAHILAFIRGDTPDDFADVAMTPAAATDLDETFGTGTSDKIMDIGWRFDAGVDAPTLQVSPEEMEACIARFAKLTPQMRDGVARYAVMHPDAGQAAITGDAGELAQILDIPSGASVPAYNRTRTTETLMCIGGTMSMSWEGSDGPQTLQPWDTVCIPAGVARSIANTGDTPAKILSIVIGAAGEVFDDVDTA
jgi:quercetin dioxygenase-like cupin family protein